MMYQTSLLPHPLYTALSLTIIPRKTLLTDKLATLEKSYKESLLKALAHLEYSFNKIQKLPIDPAELDEESLETWESFTARLARVVNLFTSKYVQTFVLINDPGFEGSLRDFMNQAEKLQLVESADKWMIARGYRNITAHEYKEEDLKHFFKELISFAPTALQIKNKLK